MNKRDAKKATDDFDGTFGDLLQIIAHDKKPDASPSVVNKTLTHGQAKGILLRAISEKPKDEKVKIWVHDVYSPAGRMKWSRAALTVQNVMRECATPAAIRAISGGDGHE